MNRDKYRRKRIRWLKKIWKKAPEHRKRKIETEIKNLKCTVWGNEYGTE